MHPDAPSSGEGTTGDGHPHPVDGDGLFPDRRARAGRGLIRAFPRAHARRPPTAGSFPAVGRQ